MLDFFEPITELWSLELAELKAVQNVPISTLPVNLICEPRLTHLQDEIVICIDRVVGKVGVRISVKTPST